MRVLVAPDSFKGSLSAPAAAAAMARGLKSVFPAADIVEIPIADGGEGTVEALVSGGGGEFRVSRVPGPLGTPVDARWGLVDGGKSAVIEMAEASGLPLLRTDELDPLRASTFGTGVLVREALDAGVTSILLGIGGSATNDGGSGFAAALGARFLDAAGQELPQGGGALARLAAIDMSGLDRRLATVRIQVACDVDNPLLGPKGASAVYGPQKGADPAMVGVLDAALARFAEIAAQTTGRHDVADVPGAGAAGGLGAGLMYFTPALLRPGVLLVLEAAHFAERCKGASLVLTGEGRTDFQTAHGKAPVGVAQAAKTHGAPGVVVACLSGGLGNGAEEVLAHGVDVIAAVPSRPMTLEECMENSAQLVEQAAFRLALALRACCR